MITSSYLPGSSLLHRFDPRLKSALLILIALSFFFPVHIYFYAVYLIGLTILAIVNLGMRELFIPLRTILPLLILVALLTPPFHRSGKILFELYGQLHITGGGLYETGRLLIRFTGITISFFLFFRSTEIETLIRTLRWYRIPFSLALVITIAFRYIPYIASLYTSISEAHKLRRPAFTGTKHNRRSSLRTRLRHLFPSLVSVLIHSIKTIPSLSMTLETRGFGRGERRTSLYSLPPLRRNTKDIVYFFLTVFIIITPLFLTLLCSSL